MERDLWLGPMRCRGCNVPKWWDGWHYVTRKGYPHVCAVSSRYRASHVRDVGRWRGPTEAAWLARFRKPNGDQTPP